MLALEVTHFSAEQREKLAGGAALPDGSFPIRNKSDLRNAIHAFGRAKNKGRAKRHIIDRACAIGGKSMLPEGWLKEADVEIEELVSIGLSDEELLQEVNVQAYVRRGKHGMVQVRRHTRGGLRRGRRVLKARNRPERTHLEGYTTDELTAAVNDPTHPIFQQVRDKGKSYADFVDDEDYMVLTAAWDAGDLSDEAYRQATDKLSDKGVREAIKRELQLRKRRIGDAGKYEQARVKSKVKRKAKAAAKREVRDIKQTVKRRAADELRGFIQ